MLQVELDATKQLLAEYSHQNMERMALKRQRVMDNIRDEYYRQNPHKRGRIECDGGMDEDCIDMIDKPISNEPNTV